MTIALSIDNPISKNEKEIYIPISTENFFIKTWLPIIEKYNLKWVPLFQSGIFITKDDSKYVQKEINLLIEYCKTLSILSEQENNHLLTRLIRLKSEISHIFNIRQNITIYVG